MTILFTHLVNICSTSTLCRYGTFLVWESKQDLKGTINVFSHSCFCTVVSQGWIHIPLVLKKREERWRANCRSRVKKAGWLECKGPGCLASLGTSLVAGSQQAEVSSIWSSALESVGFLLCNGQFRVAESKDCGLSLAQRQTLILRSTGSIAHLTYKNGLVCFVLPFKIYFLLSSDIFQSVFITARLKLTERAYHLKLWTFGLFSLAFIYMFVMMVILLILDWSILDIICLYLVIANDGI